MSEFKIEVGKSYRTSAGRPAVVDGYIDGHTYPFRGYVFRGHVCGKRQKWTEGGMVSASKNCRSEDDLIAPWEETPADLCAADVSSAFNAQAAIMGTPINPSGISDGIGDLIKTRAETHGDFFVNSNVSQGIKAILRDEPGWNRLTTLQQEALDHMCGKFGRIMAGDPHYKDHWADVAGYAQLIVKDLEAAE